MGFRVWSLVLGFTVFILSDFLLSCFTERLCKHHRRRSLRNKGQGCSNFKSQVEKRCVEAIADASLRSQKSENTGPGRMMMCVDAQRTKFCPKRAELK
jgi:hypothetical protein